MIVEWLVQLATSMGAWFVGLFPDWEVPEWFTDADGYVAGLFGFFDGLSPFIDWAFIGAICMVPMAVWLIGLTVKGVRVLIAHVPFFGGKG